jgi:hypothetical protein
VPSTRLIAVVAATIPSNPPLFGFAAVGALFSFWGVLPVSGIIVDIVYLLLCFFIDYLPDAFIFSSCIIYNDKCQQNLMLLDLP